MGRDSKLGVCFLLSILFAASHARAQGAPPPYPAPPAYGPPPTQPYPPQAYPPQGYPPPYQQPYPYTPAAPLELRYIEGRPLPSGYHIETRPRKGLVISGSIIFGVPYFLSLSVAASSKADADRWLYAPVIGPFIDLGNRKDDCSSVGNSLGSTTTCYNDSSARFFLMTDGLMQVAGITMLTLGLSLQQRILVRDDAPYVGSRASQFAWSVAPQMMGRSGLGMGLGGIF